MLIHSKSILQLNIFNSILLNAQLNNYFKLKSWIFFQSTITFFNGKKIYFISTVNSNVRLELLQKVVQYEKEHSIKLRTICLKVQNCSKALTNGHVRCNTKKQFTYINIQTLHKNHKTLSIIFNRSMIKLPESRSCCVSIWLSDAIIHNFLETVPFFLNFGLFLMKFYQLDSALRLLISPWFPWMQVLLKRW